MDCTVAVSVGDGSGTAGVAAGEGGAALVAQVRNTEKQRDKKGTPRPMPRVIRISSKAALASRRRLEEPSRREATQRGYAASFGASSIVQIAGDN
jgi:hypothetical protein